MKEYITVPGWLATLTIPFAWIGGVDPLVKGEVLASNDPNTWALIDGLYLAGQDNIANQIITLFGGDPRTTTPAPEEALPPAPVVIQPLDEKPKMNVGLMLAAGVAALVFFRK